MEIKKIGRGNNQIPVIVFETPDDLAGNLAAHILDKIQIAKNDNKKFYLGCPSGRSPFETYIKLGEIAGERQQDLSHLSLIMMDDYVFETENGYVNPPENAHYSCQRFAYVDIVDKLNINLPEEKQMSKKNVNFPPTANPETYDEKIKKNGGVDIFIIASGGSDGHIAFNPPGTHADSATRIITLAEETRRDNLGTFPDFKNLSEVPKYGVSIGLKSILELSKELVLIIHGDHKQYAVKRLNDLDDFNSDWPVSIAYRSNNVTAYLDKAAEAGLLNY